MTPQSRHRSQAGTTHPVRTVLLLLAALLPVLGLVVAAPAATAADTTPQVTFCHATNSDTNPYNLITTDADSIIKTGHDSHTGPVWDPTLKAQKIAWGDVIPAFDWVDKSGTTQHFAGLNTGSLSIIANSCAIPPIQVEVTAPVAADETCDAPGSITITAATGVAWKLDGKATTPGTHIVAPGKHTVTATALTGYAITGTATWELTVGAKTGCTVVTVTPVSPTVVASPKCGVEGSYTIPSTEGVTYLLDGDVIAAGEYPGPVDGTVTAVAKPGYALGDPSWSFALKVAAAEACPVIVVVTPVAPTVVASLRCGVEGSYTIPETTGVAYLLDGKPVAAGKHSGPVDGTVTAEALEGYTLSDSEWSFALKVAAAEACPVIVVVTPVDPSVDPSPKCGVEGTYTIPETTGVTYLLDGVVVEAGTYDGPVSGTVTAQADEGYTLADPEWSYELSVAAASACGSTLPQTGGSPAPLAGAAAALLLLGTMLVVAATRRPTAR